MNKILLEKLQSSARKDGAQVKPVKLNEILKSEYVQTAVLLLIVVISVVAFWFGLKATLRTEHPLCGVASGSMIPTLQVGDIILVQGLSPAEINAAPAPEGDIIVFYERGYLNDPNHLIVHRAIGNFSREGKIYFKTQGDNNDNPDGWDLPEDYVVGKVLLRIPLVGFITFLMRTPAGILVILPILILIIAEWFPSLSKLLES